MKKIYVPTKMDSGPFSDIRDAMGAELRSYRLEDIVRYNKEYRDFLRNHGIDKTIEMLTDKMPELSDDPKIFRQLKDAFERWPLPDYNVQCLPITADICLLEELFHGLKDLRQSITVSIYWNYFLSAKEMSISRKREPNNGIEIVKMWKSYPCFDSYDSANESRYYQDYIITRKQVTQELIMRIDKLPTGMNYDLCTELIPEDFLPIVYYDGESDHMIVASNEDQTKLMI